MRSSTSRACLVSLIKWQVGDLVAIVRSSLNDHPTALNRPAADLVIGALKEKFPCLCRMTLDGSVNARLRSSLVWHGLPMPELNEHQVSCGSGCTQLVTPISACGRCGSLT